MAGLSSTRLREIFLSPDGSYQLMMAQLYRTLRGRAPSFETLAQHIEREGRENLAAALTQLRQFRIALVTSPELPSEINVAWLGYIASVCQREKAPGASSLVQDLQELIEGPKPQAQGPAPTPDRTLSSLGQEPLALLPGQRLEISTGPLAGRKATFRRWNGITAVLEVQDLGLKWVKTDQRVRLC